MLGIVIVDYKGGERTVKYIKEELSKIMTIHKVVIVNNSATTESNSYFKKELNAELVTKAVSVNLNKSIFLIPSDRNLGFAKGNNLGADFLISNFNCDYLLFSNNDIIIKDNNVVEELISKLELDSSIGMIGPEVIGKDGHRQSPEPFIPILDRFVWIYASSFFMSARKKARRFVLDYSEKAAEGFHFRIMGSFFLIPTEVFKRIDGMDSHTFLYAEEMILAKRLERIGKKVYFYPSVTVIHDHGATTVQHLGLTKMRRIQGESEKYYYVNYCKVPLWKASFLLKVNHLLLKLQSIKNLFRGHES